MQRGKTLNRALDLYLGIPVLNMLASLKRRSRFPKRPRRIGILFNPALGDTVLGSAAAQDIRALYPWAKLTLFATASNVAAAKLVPAIDTIELLPIANPIRAIGILRRSRLELLVDFTSWQRITAIYSLLSGAQFTAGFERAKQHRHRGYDTTVAHLGDCHELENIRSMTSALGSRSFHAPQVLVPGGPLLQAALNGMQIVVLHAWASGTRSWMREWPEDRWAELAQRLMLPRRVFLLTGSPADEHRCDTLFSRLCMQGVPAQVLIGRKGLGEIARALTHAEMLISVNTGIMHLGATLGVPTVALNGPTAVHRWGAVGPRVANVRPSDGSGGYLDLGFEYRGHSKSDMDKISVADVLQAIGGLCGNRGLERNSEYGNPVWEPDVRPIAVHHGQSLHALHVQADGNPVESL